MSASAGKMYERRRRRDYLAAAVMGPTVKLSLAYPIKWPWFRIVALIFDSKSAMQHSEVGATGMWSVLNLKSGRG